MPSHSSIIAASMALAAGVLASPFPGTALRATVGALDMSGLSAAIGDCEFTITAYTASAGQQVQQLGDGQNRIGQTNIPLGHYHFVSGGIVDSHNRGCILTPPTTQWQCDEGAAPTDGFELTCNGTLTYHGVDTFYSCPTGDHDGWNLYSETLIGQEKCVPVWLKADSCFTGCTTSPTPSSTSTAPTSSLTSSKPASTTGKTSSKPATTTTSKTSSKTSTTCSSSKPSSTTTSCTSPSPAWKPVTITSTSCSTATITPTTSFSSRTTLSKTTSYTTSTPTTSSCTTSSESSSSCTTSAQVTKIVWNVAAGADATADAYANATWTWGW